MTPISLTYDGLGSLADIITQPVASDDIKSNAALDLSKHIGQGPETEPRQDPLSSTRLQVLSNPATTQ